MNDTECVRAFMQATTPHQVPGELLFMGVISDQYRLLRARLVLSEALELCDALGVSVVTVETGQMVFTDADLDLCITPGVSVDLVETADACADLRYVVVGTEIALGIPGDAVFAEVHRSNMTKLMPDGTALVDAGGKVMKPPHFTPPDVVGVLERHREEF